MAKQEVNCTLILPVKLALFGWTFFQKKGPFSLPIRIVWTGLEMNIYLGLRRPCFASIGGGVRSSSKTSSQYLLFPALARHRKAEKCRRAEKLKRFIFSSGIHLSLSHTHTHHLYNYLSLFSKCPYNSHTLSLSHSLWVMLCSKFLRYSFLRQPRCLVSHISLRSQVIFSICLFVCLGLVIQTFLCFLIILRLCLSIFLYWTLPSFGHNFRFDDTNLKIRRRSRLRDIQRQGY